MHQIFFHTLVCWWKTVLANYYLIIYPHVSIIHGMQFCGISDNSMARISFMTANHSNTESHTSMDKFLWYFHDKHWWQSDEKLALKHHSGLKKSSAIYFYKHMRNPSIPSCCTTGEKKHNVQNSCSVSLIPAFEKKNPAGHWAEIWGLDLRARIALMEMPWFWRPFLPPLLILCNVLSGAQEPL